jgi:hypothetical protein
MHEDDAYFRTLSSQSLVSSVETLRTAVGMSAYNEILEIIRPTIYPFQGSSYQLSRAMSSGTRGTH